jgi:N-acetylglucosamine-6-sulfatase
MLGESLTHIGWTGSVRIPRPRRTLGNVALCLGVVFLLVATACSDSDTGSKATPTSEPAPSTTSAGAAGRPNIVVVVTDDLDLTSFLNAKRFPKFHDLMTRRGTTFSNYFVVDSLCCPSRASILRGQYVHNHDVEGNIPPNGGFEHWQELRRDRSTVATWLHDAGYRTGLLGKYLNGYPNTASPTYVPPGWDTWASPAAGNAYAEYNYKLNENGTLRLYRRKPADYLVDVLAQKSRDFIAAPNDARPFFLYVAPYVPHAPATPAPRHADAFPGARAPRTPSFDQEDMSAEPSWLAERPHLRPAVTTYIDQIARRRLQSMLAIEDMFGKIVETLRQTGQLDNTYIVFTSDNGFHLGQHRLPPGKQTAFEEDIHVPLVVRGPGVPAGRIVGGFAREIDLAPTFAALGRAATPSFVDGVSLTPLLTGDTAAPETRLPRDVLVEHFGIRRNRTISSASTEPDDDAHPPLTGAPTSGPAAPVRGPRVLAVAVPPYRALRTARYLYVEYNNGGKQLYDLSTDPDELHNIATTADPAIVRALATRLAALARCSAASCRT